MLQVITTSQELAALRDDWNGLTREPLRSFDWHDAWWKYFGDELTLRVYVYRAAGRVVGIAPFFIDRWLGQQRLRFLASGKTCTDYAQIIASNEYRQQFANALVTHWRESNPIPIIELEGISSTRPDHTFCDALQKSHRHYQKELDSTWLIELPGNWDEFLSQTNKSLRRKIKTASQRLQSREVEIVSTRDQLPFDDAFATLVELHQERFVSKGEPGVFNDPRFTGFLKQAAGSLASDGRCQIVVANVGTESIAAQLYFFSENGPQLYQSGIRSTAMSLAPGHLMFTYAVRSAIESGYRQFDFLRGDEPYKEYWGAAPHRLLTIRCVSRNWLPTLLHIGYNQLRGWRQTLSALSTRITSFSLQTARTN